ncbi:MAG: site-2 protease family protein [Solirubrobacterales bacterium]
MFRSTGSITLGRVRGIRIGVDYSWFVVLFLIILWLSGYYRDILGDADTGTMAYGLAVASAFLFFGSILLHELGHAFVAIRNNIGIAGIDLWLFGGVARMERDSDSPGAEFKIAVAGPLVTLGIVIVGALIGIAVEGGTAFRDATLVRGDAAVSPALAVLAWVTSINLLLLVFNLLPAFPLDGGRIARAIAWRFTGERAAATRIAGRLGQGFAYLFIGFGILLAIQGVLLSGVWLAFIGIMLNQSAGAAIVQSAVTGRLEHISVDELMDGEPVAIPEGLSLARAQDEFFLRYRWPWFPVTDPQGRFEGVLRQSELDDVPEERRELQSAGDTIDRSPERPTITTGSPLEAVLGNEWLRKLGAVMVVDEQRRLLGVLSAQQVGRSVRSAVRPTPAAGGPAER